MMAYCSNGDISRSTLGLPLRLISKILSREEASDSAEGELA